MVQHTNNIWSVVVLRWFLYINGQVKAGMSNSTPGAQFDDSPPQMHSPNLTINRQGEPGVLHDFVREDVSLM